MKITAIVPAALLLLAPALSRADEEATQLQTAITKYAPCICTVKALIKMEMKGQGEFPGGEQKVTVQGVVVDPDGLIMISYMPFSPKRMMEMLGAPSEEMGSLKATPTNIKVVFDKEEKEYDAFLAANDPRLDLGFIKVEGLADRKLTAVDFGGTGEAAIGQRVIAVSRLTKGYDYAPFVQTARVVGEIGKPRKAWMIEGSITGFGLPVLLPSGEALGVLSTVPSGVKEDGARDQMGFAMMMRMLSGGGGSPGGAFIIPAAPVKALIEQAKAQAVTVAAERAKKKAEPVPAPTPAKKPTPTNPPKKKP